MSAAEIASRYGVETDPHALNDVVLRKTLPVGARAVDITGIVEPLLDRHAEAILAHGRMLWGDEARGLQVLWMTGGGAQLLGARLQQLAPHAALVANASIQNAVGLPLRLPPREAGQEVARRGMVCEFL